MADRNDVTCGRAVRESLTALADVLVSASCAAQEADTVVQNCDPTNRGGHNQAMGLLCSLETDLVAALALYRAAVALHIRGRREERG